MFAELLCRTHYSFLRGASHPHELVDQAAALGLRAIGIVDLDGVYGIPKAYRAAKAHPDLKLIVGATVTLEDHPKLNLLSMNRTGYGLMCRILSASHEGKPKGQASLRWNDFLELMKRPEGAGLIAIPEETPQGVASAGIRAGFYSELKSAFQDRLYIPLSRVFDGWDRKRTEVALALSQEWDAPIVATNNVHYHVSERRVLHDVLTSIREIVPLNEIGTHVFSNAERYLKSPAEMAALFQDLPDAVSNTIRVAERCHFCPSELKYRYPSEWIPAGETAQSYLDRLVYAGTAWRYPASTYPDGVPLKVQAQIAHELKLIAELGFADYFLTIWEIVEFAKERDILCQGRGSAANSVVCYCLGITAIDPVKMDLLFERFISVERGEPPDIDIDFEHERREEVIQHIYSKYGRDRAGMVSAIITYRRKSVKRDVGKALGLVSMEGPEAEARLEPFVEQLRGFPRHLSIHSGGFTLSADPMIETVPIEPARMEGRTIVQWDKEDLDAIGLLKVDVLALGMLTALKKTLDLIKPKREFTLATIPANDKETYKMIQKAETVGVFQIESRAQMSMLRRLKPRNFYDLVVEVAIVRPGPIVGQMVHPYLKRRRGLESSASPDPRLEPIFARTLGVPLFQEQVMKMAVVMAGFSAGEADELRRAIGAWRSSGSIEKLGKKLMAGLLKEGLPVEFVERIFKQIQGFAEYGFPESHAASFALLAYASSYFKCHYPMEFTCALVNSQPMGFYSIHTLIEECKRQGVRVLPVDPNRSYWDCTLEESADGREALRMGFRVVSGLGKKEVERLIADRETRGQFSSLQDFIFRVRFSMRVLNTLAMGEAFSSFGLNQRDSLWQILADQILREGAGANEPEQLGLFTALTGTSSQAASRDLFAPLGDFEAVQSDYESFQMSVREHPMRALRREPAMLRILPKTTTQSVKQGVSGSTARAAGLIICRQRPSTAKGTVFATLEDEHGFLDLILHEKTYDRFREVFVSHAFLCVRGRVQKDNDIMNLIVHHVSGIGFENLRTQSHDFR